MSGLVFLHMSVRLPMVSRYGTNCICSHSSDPTAGQSALDIVKVSMGVEIGSAVDMFVEVKRERENSIGIIQFHL
jgi:hypothetical protein